MNIESILNQVYYDNTLQQWLIALGVAIVLSFVLSFINNKILKHLKILAKKTHQEIDDLIVEILSKTNLILLFLISLYVGTLFLDLNERISSIRKDLIIIALLLQLGFWGSGLISYYINRRILKDGFTTGGKVTQLKTIGFIAKVFIWIIVILLMIDNLGFNVTTLITGLGIGGIAIALAVQNVLGDVIASLSIIIDKPFEVGDFIIVDELMGNVEDIGLKTTRVRSLSGEQLIFSNNDLLQSRIKNYKRMNDRRILFTLGVVYGTPYEKLQKIPEFIKEIIDKEPKTRFDRAHFNNYGAYSLDFEIVYYVLSPDYNIYMSAQQEINLKLYKKFDDEGIEFAFPTQTLFVSGEENNGSTLEQT